MKPRRIWLFGSLGLVFIWILAIVGIQLIRAQKMTLEKTLDYLSSHSLNSKNAAERMQVVEGLAQRVSQLSFEERQRLRFDRNIRAAYQKMTDEERARYLDLTLPGGMKQMMDAFNKMNPDKRKQLVNRAVNELNRAQNEVSREDMEKALLDQNVKRIIDEGLKSYLSDANASAKLDIQPLIEQMQNIMHGAR